LQQQHTARRHADDGSWREKKTKWGNIKVGDVLMMRDGELFPADLLCLHCALPERIAYVTTTNLDGETNLKVKRCAPASRLLAAPLLVLASIC
jgi:P-type E1-E2 ATPase